MSEYPPLSPDEKSKILELYSKGLKPKQIGKELKLDPEHASRRVQGVLLRNVWSKKSKKASPEAVQTTPETVQPASPEAVQTAPETVQPASPEGVQVPKPNNPGGGGKEVALEEKDVEKIVAQVAQTVAQAVGPAVGSAVEDVLSKQDKNKRQKEIEAVEKKAAQERIVKTEQKLEEVATTVKTMEDFCKKFPELCDQVKELSEAMKKEPEKPKEAGEGHKEPVHSTAKEYFECPECSNPLIIAQSKMIKENKEFAKRVYEAFKEAGAFETLEKFKEKPEEKKSEKVTVV